MSKLHGAKRFGVFLREISWLLLSELYALVRFLVILLGSLAAGLWAFFWVIGAMFDVPDVRHYFGPWFLWTVGGMMLFTAVGDLLFRREGK